MAETASVSDEYSIHRGILEIDLWITYNSDIILNNWLVNPTGNPNSWVPVDLLQEHMNFWIKVIHPKIP